MILKEPTAKVLIVLFLIIIFTVLIGCTLILNNGGDVKTDKGEPNYGFISDNENESDTD